GDVVWPTGERIAQVVKGADDQPIDLIVLRDGAAVTLDPITPRRDVIGIAHEAALDVPIVAQVLPGSPAASLNLPAGSRIESINGRPVSNWGDMQQAIAASDGGEIAVTYT